MFELRLCRTRDYPPILLEHWLHTIQSERSCKEFSLCEKDGKIKIFLSHSWESVLKGSRCVPAQAFKGQGSFRVSQNKSPLLPIKRYRQFEDRSERFRLSPMDELVRALKEKPGAFIKIQFRALPDKKRKRALKKAKRAWFQPYRNFDLWESQGWFSWSKLWPRRIFGPLIRRFLFFASEDTRKPEEKTQTQHEREEVHTAILDKLSRPLFELQIQVSEPLESFFQGLSLPYLGQLRLKKISRRKFRSRDRPLILSAEELATVLSLPSPENSAQFLDWESTAYLESPFTGEPPLTDEDQKRHRYLLGKTGMGKSTLLLKWLEDSFQEKKPVVLLDPHGDLLEDALKKIPKEREKDCVILDPSSSDFPFAFNPLEYSPDEAPLKASNLVEAFKALNPDSWGPRLEYILRNALFTLALNKNRTLLDLPLILVNRDFCRKQLEQIRDPVLLRFWNEEYWPLEKRILEEHRSPILNKVGALLTLPQIRNILAQPIGKFDFESAFKENQIVLIKVPKGSLGEDGSRMIGILLLSQIYSTLMKRAQNPGHDRSTVKVFIDEFHNFATPTLIRMLSESRKYGLALTLANQYLDQVPSEIRESVLGNVGSLWVFRTSYKDAKDLAPVLGLTESDLTELAPFHAYAKILLRASLLPVFRTELHWAEPNLTSEASQIEKLKLLCQKRFGRPRAQVEEKLLARYNAIQFQRPT